MLAILMAQFFGFPSDIQIPTLLWAFAFPLFVQEPSVKAVIASLFTAMPLWVFASLCAGVGDSFSGFVKTLKPSASSV